VWSAWRCQAEEFIGCWRLAEPSPDLAESEIIEPAHLAEAVPPRPPLKSAYCANDTM
jgi:hypothetical protein